MRIRTLRAVLGLALVLSPFAYAGLSAEGETAAQRLPTVDERRSLVVRGKIEGLYPGNVQKMWVKVRNRHDHWLLLRRIRTVAPDASHGCTAEHLGVQRLKRRKKTAPPHTRRIFKVTVEMLASAPDSCQGASFPLRFKATATKL